MHCNLRPHEPRQFFFTLITTPCQVWSRWTYPLVPYYIQPCVPPSDRTLRPCEYRSLHHGCPRPLPITWQLTTVMWRETAAVNTRMTLPSLTMTSTSMTGWTSSDVTLSSASAARTTPVRHQRPIDSATSTDRPSTTTTTTTTRRSTRRPTRRKLAACSRSRRSTRWRSSTSSTRTSAVPSAAQRLARSGKRSTRHVSVACGSTGETWTSSSLSTSTSKRSSSAWSWSAVSPWSVSPSCLRQSHRCHFS